MGLLRPQYLCNWKQKSYFKAHQWPLCCPPKPLVPTEKGVRKQASGNGALRWRSNRRPGSTSWVAASLCSCAGAPTPWPIESPTSIAIPRSSVQVIRACHGDEIAINFTHSLLICCWFQAIENWRGCYIHGWILQNRQSFCSFILDWILHFFFFRVCSTFWLYSCSVWVCGSAWKSC